MTDVLTTEQRQLNMSRIRGRDTKPELLIRHGLHARGLRYRLHDRKLPGRPDLAFSQHRAAIFVHGCFWHMHGCSLSKLPATRHDFWQRKLEANAARDRKAINALQAVGWRVLVVWECAVRGRRRHPIDNVLTSATAFIRNGQPAFKEISGEAERQPHEM
jgi:DNA mismatch endonuclease (patch repair protein)